MLLSPAGGGWVKFDDFLGGVSHAACNYISVIPHGPDGRSNIVAKSADPRPEYQAHAATQSQFLPYLPVPRYAL